MCEVPVQADTDPEPGDVIEHKRYDDIVPAKAPAPGQRYGRDEREQRHGNEDADKDALKCGSRLGIDLRPGSGWRLRRRALA